MSSPRELIIDVAVIGSGFAGLAAAIEASNSGAEKVVVFEKMSVPGGNSVWNAGQIAAVGTKAQDIAGINDSVDLMMKDMITAGINLNHPKLVKKMCSESNNTILWTESELGVKHLSRVSQLGGHSIPRTLSTENASGRDYIDPMLKRISDQPGVQLELNTAFEDFIMDNDRKHVLGIRVRRQTTGGEAEKERQNIICKLGVVLASGGFSSDVAFRSIQNPAFGEGVMSTNHPGATAEVIKQSIKIGALPVQLSHIQLGPWTSPDEEGFGRSPYFCLGAGFPYGIIVDPATSRRFANELGKRYERSMAILELGHPAVCITDIEGARHSLERNLDKLKPALQGHDSIESLANAYDMDPNELEKTIKDYNEGVARGNDVFRKQLRPDLKPIAKSPFFSVRLWPKVHHCCGGLHINSDTQVMHVDGHPIKGLFAAGEVTGGVHGADRIGSVATLDCLTFGRIAGHNVATIGEQRKEDD